MKKRYALAVVILTSLLAGLALAQTPAQTPPAATAAPATRPATRPQGVPNQQSATDPVIQPRTENRHQSFLDIAKKGDIDLLFIGDSITDNWRTRGKAVWDKNFAPLKAANFGIGADRTQNVLWRLQNGELDGFKAKCIVLMLGTNNVSAGRAIRNTNEQVLAGMKLVINEIRTRQPQAKLLLLAIFPRGHAADDPYRQPIKEINAELAKYDDGKNIFFMDIGPKFLAPDGTLPAELFPDLLHPNEQGYQIWTDATLDKVKQLMAMPPQ